MAAYVKSILVENNLCDGHYVEPFAGGAAVAQELLFEEYVSHIHINDISRPVHAFWKSVLCYTDELCKLIVDTPRTVRAWDRQKAVLMNLDDYDDLEVGFAAFYLNRTNRSGILNGGIIGGRSQEGEWKIDARYNAPDLIDRINAIATMRSRIRLTRRDALRFLTSGVKKWPKNTLIYLDPPYYEKGRDLYYDYYTHDDHESVSTFVRSQISAQRWLVSYDNADPIQALYAGCKRVIYKVGYSARERSEGDEVMFFDRRLTVPPLVGPIRECA
jgi:DNA adenine methylase